MNNDDVWQWPLQGEKCDMLHEASNNNVIEFPSKVFALLNIKSWLFLSGLYTILFSVI